MAKITGYRKYFYTVPSVIMTKTDQLQRYDDTTTFKAKIDYANKMGLSGLMVWAIDQDDSDLSALTAVTGGTSKRQSSGGDFDLVDLDRLFPKEYIPSDTSGTEYGLITFGAGSESGELDPTLSGFGFLIAVGDSHGLTQLKKRGGRPDPFVFLDCPEDVLDQPHDKPQKARVVCTSADVEGCFRVTERGVEGTMVEMPDECAPNSFARAISLELAKGEYRFIFTAYTCDNLIDVFAPQTRLSLATWVNATHPHHPSMNSPSILTRTKEGPMRK
jgi:hypothetical protein